MLDHTFYDFIPAKGAEGTYLLGDRCHQQKQASTPVWVVTDIHGNIIINTEPESEVGWVVTKGRITINRFFTSSTAMVVCACKGLDPDQPFPPLPGGLVRKNLDANFVRKPEPIDKGDEFCIWCGYIDGLRPVTTADLIAGNLIRTFVGAVDTIVMAGNANAGVQVIIQARDRMKYLMDSLGTFNSVDFDVFKNSDGNKNADFNPIPSPQVIPPTEGAGGSSTPKPAASSQASGIPKQLVAFYPNNIVVLGDTAGWGKTEVSSGPFRNMYIEWVREDASLAKGEDAQTLQEIADLMDRDLVERIDFKAIEKKIDGVNYKGWQYTATLKPGAAPAPAPSTQPNAATQSAASPPTSAEKTYKAFIPSYKDNYDDQKAQIDYFIKTYDPTTKKGVWFRGDPPDKQQRSIEDIIKIDPILLGGYNDKLKNELLPFYEKGQVADVSFTPGEDGGIPFIGLGKTYGLKLVVTLNEEGAKRNPQAQQNKKQAEEDAVKRGISRVDVIVELARRCIGHLEFSKSLGQMATSVCKTVGGYIIQKRYIKDYGDVSQNADKIFTVYDGLRPEVVNGQTTYSWNGQTDPFLGGVTRTPNLRLVAEDLVFNVISGRRPFLTTAAQNNWLGNNQNITDRVPAEFIKFLSLQEPWPTELFADSRSGEYWYAPRGLDYSGLYDPKRFFRTYFFRKAPADALASLYESRAKVIGEDPQGDWKGKPIHSCQAALLFREESTTINWRSNIIATNSSIASNTSQMAVHIKIVPYWLVGRAYPCSYYQVVDQTIGNNASELVAVALSQARLYGKELRAASLHILGDPSLVPGEAIQVVGSPLYDTPGAWITDRDKVADYYKTYEAVYLNGLYKTKSNSDGLDSGVSTAQQPPVYAPKEKNLQDFFKQTEAVSVKDSPQLSQAQIMCPATFGTETASTTDPSGTAKNSIPAGDPRESPKKTSSNIEQDKLINSVTFPEDPRSIWRVEAVIHKFNENPGDGYRTEVALASPF